MKRTNIHISQRERLDSLSRKQIASGDYQGTLVNNAGT